MSSIRGIMWAIVAAVVLWSAIVVAFVAVVIR